MIVGEAGGVGPVARLLSSAWAIVSRILGRSFREWSEWAAREPGAAAFELELVASVLEGRSRAYRRPDGWRGRRDRNIASSLRAHARQLRSASVTDRTLASGEVARVCSIVPGTLPVPTSGEVRSLP